MVRENQVIRAGVYCLLLSLNMSTLTTEFANIIELSNIMTKVNLRLCELGCIQKDACMSGYMPHRIYDFREKIKSLISDHQKLLHTIQAKIIDIRIINTNELEEKVIFAREQFNKITNTRSIQDLKDDLVSYKKNGIYIPFLDSCENPSNVDYKKLLTDVHDINTHDIDIEKSEYEKIVSDILTRINKILILLQDIQETARNLINSKKEGPLKNFIERIRSSYKEFSHLKGYRPKGEILPETLATYLLHFIQAQIKMGSILSLEAELKSLHPGWNTMGRDATHAICPVLFSNAQQARETELRKQNPASSSTACDLLAPVVCLPDNLACAAPDFSGGDCNVNC